MSSRQFLVYLFLDDNQREPFIKTKGSAVENADAFACKKSHCKRSVHGASVITVTEVRKTLQAKLTNENKDNELERLCAIFFSQNAGKSTTKWMVV